MRLYKYRVGYNIQNYDEKKDVTTMCSQVLQGCGEEQGKNIGLMGQGLFHGLNTREQENWVVSGLGISVCLLVFCTLCNFYVYSGFFSLVRDVDNWAEPR